MKYTILKRKNPLNRLIEKYYLNARSAGTVDLDAICEEISHASSLTRGDVTNVVMSFLDIIPRHVKRGFTVKLGELGCMRLSINSEGSDSPEEVSIAKVKKVHLVFLPSTKFKKEIANTPLELFAA